MRKALKLKASVLLLAWVLIFAHSIIPHNHHDEFNDCCHSLVHSLSCSNSISDENTKIEGSPSEKIVCHYSGFIFHQLNADNLIIITDKTDFLNPLELKASKLLQKSVLLISDPHLGSSALRAPPLS